MNLTLVSIAYNEEEHIEFWYNHHKELVDEVVLVDTGSTDNTVKKAKELGIKVFNYNWQHNFADAKNFAISCCKSKWVMFMDTDCYIDKKYFDEIRSAIQNDNKVMYDAGLYEHFDKWPFGEKKIKSQYRHALLFRNIPEIRFERRIHERVEPQIMRQPHLASRIAELRCCRNHDSVAIKSSRHKMFYYHFLKIYQELERTMNQYGKDLRRNAYQDEKKLSKR